MWIKLFTSVALHYPNLDKVTKIRCHQACCPFWYRYLDFVHLNALLSSSQFIKVGLPRLVQPKPILASPTLGYGDRFLGITELS